MSTRKYELLEILIQFADKVHLFLTESLKNRFINATSYTFYCI